LTDSVSVGQSSAFAKKKIPLDFSNLRKKKKQTNRNQMLSHLTKTALRCNFSSSSSLLSEAGVHRSARPPIDIAETPLPVEILRRMSKFDESLPALTCTMTGQSLNYGEACAQIRGIARTLASRKFGRGDTLLINAPNIVEYPSIFHGALLSGGVVTTASPQFRASELAGQISDSQSSLVATVPALLDVTLEAAHGVGLASSQVVVVGGNGEQGALTFADLLSEGDGNDLPSLDEVDVRRDVAALPYSSGTTGAPKGVMLSHRNLLANMLQLEDLEQGSDERSYEVGETLSGILPMFHIYSLLMCVNFALASGLHLALAPKFDLPNFLQAAQDYRMRTLHIVPPIAVALAKHPIVDKYDLSSLQYIFSGAAPLATEIIDLVQQRLGVKTRSAYGLSECSPAVTVTPKSQASLHKQSVGPLLANTEIKAVDPSTCKTVPDGEFGEFWVRGPQVMLGYWKRPDADAETLVDDNAGEQWLRTGDAGHIDAATGHVFIEDRIKEFIKVKGHQVAPSELEDVLHGHANVADAVVIGVQDEVAGELPKAFVQLNAGVEPTDALRDDILQFVKDRVAFFKKLAFVEFIDLVPKSASGKILRRLVRDQERAKNQ
jgi:acyl-CoA synthetase (AMP-forming)/AMP-acid ligase II